MVKFVVSNLTTLPKIFSVINDSKIVLIRRQRKRKKMDRNIIFYQMLKNS